MVGHIASTVKKQSDKCGCWASFLFKNLTYSLLTMYKCLCVGMCMSVGAQRLELLDFLVLESSSPVPPDIGAGDRTQVLWKSRTHSTLPRLPSLHHFSFASYLN